MSAYNESELHEVLTKSVEFYFSSSEYNPEFISFIYQQFGARQLLAVVEEMMIAHREFLETKRNGLDAAILKIKAAEKESEEMKLQHLNYLEG